ncbi:MAG: hypothetical protein HYY34_07655, partial [Chloroflexi bacterium]|nr:hypothetical protein [Chloroflexota bacterium]
MPTITPHRLFSVRAGCAAIIAAIVAATVATAGILASTALAADPPPASPEIADDVAPGVAPGTVPSQADYIALFFEEEPWWHHPLSLAEPPRPPREPFDPTPNYVDHLRRFMSLAVATLKAGNPDVRVTTNFGRNPFDESAIDDGVRFFEQLPELDVI